MKVLLVLLTVVFIAGLVVPNSQSFNLINSYLALKGVSLSVAFIAFAIEQRKKPQTATVVVVPGFRLAVTPDANETESKGGGRQHGGSSGVPGAASALAWTNAEQIGFSIQGFHGRLVLTEDSLKATDVLMQNILVSVTPQDVPSFEMRDGYLTISYVNKTAGRHEHRKFLMTSEIARQRFFDEFINWTTRHNLTVEGDQF